jgi:hypothetical protein
MKLFLVGLILLSDFVSGWNIEGHKFAVKVAARSLSRKTARFVKNHFF